MEQLSYRQQFTNDRLFVSNNTCFYAAVAYYMVLKILDYSFYASVPFISFIDGDIRLAVVCIGLIVVNEWINRQSRYDLKTLAVFAVLLILSVIVLVKSGKPVPLTLLAFIFGARNVDLNKVLRICLYTSLGMLAFIVLSSLIGVIPNYVDEAPNRNRQFLGFLYALYAPQIVFNCTLIYLIVRRNAVKFLPVLGFIVLALGCYFATDSRSLVVLTCLVALLGYCYSRWAAGLARSRVSRFTHAFFSWLTFPVALIASFVFPLIITNHFSIVTYVINKALGSRMSLSQKAIDTYGISIFGNDIEWSGAGLSAKGMSNGLNQYNYVDSTFVKACLDYGIVFVIAMVVTYTLLMVRESRHRQYVVVLVLFILAIHAFFDNLFLILCFNSLWFCAVYLVRDLRNYRRAPSAGRHVDADLELSKKSRSLVF
ncbi:hypothetical protein KIMH_04040 [Bombiscardovia apis]|uniref:Polymerase n=1 Tax=Bombiscardovia apis TaxID=2932182 RepID=A0ABN6SF34_9BIFI|nr:hypothetical protein [Bombiscardovia apis]BDR54293.1 hypothetical protein KIMH_04040 [Bombiscardovia apis]